MRTAGMTRLEVLVVILLVAVLAFFVVPAVFVGRKRVTRIQCANHLRSIICPAIAYALSHKDRLPFGDGPRPRAFESLQVLVDYDTKYRDPDVYVCPGGDEEPAETDGAGNFRLSERNVSYAYIAEPVKYQGDPPSKRPVLCDHGLDHHKDGIAVIRLDGSSDWMPPEELEKEPGGFEAFLEANGLTK